MGRAAQSPAPERRWPVGRAIMERIRHEVNDPDGPFFTGDDGEDVFAALYLSERDGCIPDRFIGDDLLNDIRTMYYAVLDGVREELRARLQLREFLSVLVDPSYEDTTEFVMMTSEQVLLFGGSKAWHFYWDSEEAMAEELEDWYRGAASRLAPQRRELQPSEDGWYTVTLRLERVLQVAADTPQQALERAVHWRSNEDNDQVRLLYEEITDDRVETGGDDDR